MGDVKNNRGGNLGVLSSPEISFTCDDTISAAVTTLPALIRSFRSFSGSLSPMDVDVVVRRALVYGVTVTVQ